MTDTPQQPPRNNTPRPQRSSRPFIRGGRLISPSPRPPRAGAPVGGGTGAPRFGGHRPPHHGGSRPLNAGAPRPQGQHSPHSGGGRSGGRPNPHRGGNRGGGSRDRRGGFRKGGPNRGGGQAGGQQIKHNQEKSAEMKIIPPVPAENVRIIALGGVEEIGRNMTVIETAEDIIVVDMGVQFSEDDTPGVDFILPNPKYLEDRKDKIRGVVITHGHLDHIGAIPYLMEAIGNPPIYTRHFTSLMIKKRQEEFVGKATLDIREVEENMGLKMGNLTVNFFSVVHSIPDALAIAIDTPWGEIVHTGDLRLNHDNGVVAPEEEVNWGRFKDKKVLLTMMDSTNADSPGFSLSEQVVVKNIDEIIRTVPNRLIISTFASQVDRIIAIIASAEKYGKKVVIEGRSMKNNLEVIRLDGRLPIKPETIIQLEDMGNYPESKIVALVTGAQGEEFAALMRIANRTHKHIRLTKKDTVLLSSSVIPGNERGVQKLKDNISRQGANIIHSRTHQIHASGHSNADESAWIHSKVREKFFIPIHGYHYMLRSHGDIAVRTGVEEKNVMIPDNGMIIEIEKGERIFAREEKAPSSLILVDGFSVGEIQEVVLRDRQMLAEDGVFVIYGIIDLKTKKMIKSPDIISRGFVYLRESQELLSQARLLAKKIIEKECAGPMQVDFDQVREAVRDAIEKFLFQETHKQPIVISVVFGI